MRQKVYRAFKDFSYLLSSWFKVIGGAWLQVWEDIESALKIGKKVVSNWRLWLSAVVITSLFIISQRTIFNQYSIVFWERKLIPIEIGSLLIQVDYPQYIASQSTSSIELSINNTGNQTYKDVEVILSTQENLFIFKEGNVIHMDELKPGESRFATVPFETVRNLPRDIEIYSNMSIQYQFDNSIEHYNTHFPNPLVKFNLWLHYWTLVTRLLGGLPIVLDGIITGLGIIGALLLALLTLRGNLGKMIEAILPSFLKEIDGNKGN